MTQFNQGEIRGIQDYEGGRMEVYLKTTQGVERLLAEPVLKLHDHVDVFFEYRGVRTSYVHGGHGLGGCRIGLSLRWQRTA